MEHLPLDPNQSEQLKGWDQVEKQPESCDGQHELFSTGRALPKNQRQDFKNGQDFLFDLTKNGNKS